MGCTIEAAGLGVWKQGISILAGPLGSFSLLLFYRIAPQLAICGCLQGLYNLLPLGPLDGGRLLKIMLYQFCPNYADVVRYFIGFGICILFDLGIVWMMRYYATGVWPVFAAVSWNVSMVPRKIPCKPGRIGVQ